MDIALSRVLVSSLPRPLSVCCSCCRRCRYDAARVGKQTRIKFMTDGILLREIQDVRAM